LTPLNHFPFVLMVLALVLHMAGVMFNRTSIPWSNIFRTCWPLLALALFALVGSAYAKWGQKLDDSYLTFGIYMLLLPLFVAVTADGACVDQWKSALVTMWSGIVLLAIAGEVARFGSEEILHEIEYLVLAGFFTLYYYARSVAVRLLAILLMLAASALNLKLTGFLIAGLGLLHIMVVGGWRRMPRTWRGFYGLGAFATSLVVIAVVVAVYYYFRDSLPTGNSSVRLKQYEQAYTQFIASPLWGDAYTKGSGELYREGARVMNIPTHSDVMDILKHGGLLGVALFFIGYWKIFALLNRAIAATRATPRLHAYFTGMRFFQVTALITFSFNPVMLKGPFLIAIWGSLGLACGLALAVLGNPLRSRPA
jgi:hypothetical protein